jgi:hypothetical protein
MHAQAGDAFGGSTIKGSSDLWEDSKSSLCRPLKYAHLQRCPVASPSRLRAEKSLLIRRDATLVLRRYDVHSVRLTAQDFGRLASVHF